MPYIIEPMRTEDIPAVMDVERESFSSIWPASAYRREILENRLAHYAVLREVNEEETQTPVEETTAQGTGPESPPGGLRQLVSTLREWVTGTSSEAVRAGLGQVVGYVGLWMMVDEAHITTIAVRSSRRKRGLGELLLVAAVEMALALGARVVTLEVRVSNLVAQSLYEKFGFMKVGSRLRYYTDNNEDALIMTSPNIRSAAFQAHFAELRQRNRERVGEVVWRLPD